MSGRIKKAGSLTDEEVSVIRNLLGRGGYTNQEILGLINTLRRHDSREETNGGRISEVKTNKTRYAGIEAATDDLTNRYIDRAENPAAYSGISLNPLDKKRLKELFPINSIDSTKLDITETDFIECKASFGTQHLISNCLKAFAGFSNNKGGYIAFGVKDKTWDLVGIDGPKFKALDRKKLNQALLSNLSCALNFDLNTFDIEKKTIGVIYVYPAQIKPVMAVKSGPDGVGVGHIYYRYQAENRLIGPTELQKIIEDRIKSLSETILTKHISNIIKNGIENSAILNISTGQVEGKAGSFLIDEELLPEISFIKEGEFAETSGAPTLKLVGEIETAAAVIKTQKEELIKLYPFSWTQLSKKVTDTVDGANTNIVNKIIKNEGIKSNRTYSAYNFRTNEHREKFEETGSIPSGTPSIYNQNAVDFVIEKAKAEVQQLGQISDV